MEDLYVPTIDVQKRAKKQYNGDMNGNVEEHEREQNVQAVVQQQQQQQPEQQSMIQIMLSFLFGTSDTNDQSDVDEFDFGTDDEADPDFVASATGQFRDEVCVKIGEHVFIGVKPSFDWHLFDEVLNEDDENALREMQEVQQAHDTSKPGVFTSPKIIDVEDMGNGGDGGTKDLEMHAFPQSQRMIDIETSGGVYVLKSSSVMHFIQMVDDVKSAESRRTQVECRELIFDVKNIMSRKGEYKGVDENYYWSYKLVEQYVQQSVGTLEFALRKLQNNAESRQAIEQSISALRMLVPQMEEKKIVDVSKGGINSQ